MADLIESARAVLSGSERRLEVAANNVANLTTAGFKKQSISFGSLRDPQDGVVRDVQTETHFEQGRLSRTGNSLDLAINGDGFFELAGADGAYFSRGGQFRLADDGRLVDMSGRALQQDGGGDLILHSADVLITADGTVLADALPVAKIALHQPEKATTMTSVGGSLFRAEGPTRPVETPDIRQGMAEASNVVLADEMLGVMEAMREAETGARFVQVYDDLMGRAITTFGQGGR